MKKEKEMNFFKIWRRNFCLLIFISLLCFLPANAQKIPTTKLKKDLPSPFRYVIFENRVEDKEDPKLESRFLEILMDEKAFSEKNIKTLFALVSKRFPKPYSLEVRVYTSLEQIATPEEMDNGATSESNEPSPPKKYYWALYLRHEYAEFFRFSPLKDKAGMKTVELRENQK